MEDIIFSKACEIYAILDNEIYDFKNNDINEQIDDIIYCVNELLYNDSDIIEHIIIEKIFTNCHIACENVNYPYMKGKSELGYLQEWREAQTFAMIESVIKDLYEYYKKKLY
jgi:hypothetical protein